VAKGRTAEARGVVLVVVVVVVAILGRGAGRAHWVQTRYEPGGVEVVSQYFQLMLFNSRGSLPLSRADPLPGADIMVVVL
jgi:hypothetical protein